MIMNMLPIDNNILYETLITTMQICNVPKSIDEHVYYVVCTTILTASNCLYRTGDFTDFNEKVNSILIKLWMHQDEIDSIHLNELVMTTLTVFNAKLIEFVDIGWNATDIITDKQYDEFENYVKQIYTNINCKDTLDDILLKINGLIDADL